MVEKGKADGLRLRTLVSASDIVPRVAAVHSLGRKVDTSLLVAENPDERFLVVQLKCPY